MRRLFNVEQSEYFISIVEGRTAKEISKLMYDRFGIKLTRQQITTQKRLHRVTSYNLYRRKDVAEWMKENVPNTSNGELAERFSKRFGIKVTYTQMRSLKRRLGLKSGLKTYSPEGIKKPMSKETYEKIKPTMFKKGNIPPSAANIGEERYRKHKDCVFVKIGEKQWARKHVLVWEKAHGKIPKNQCIIFADGNTRNCNLDNLLLVTNSENVRMRKNKLMSDIPEITKINLGLVRLQIAIENAKNRLKGNSQREAPV